MFDIGRLSNFIPIINQFMAFDRKRSLTFGDALKSSRRTAFSSMIKPIGSLCNLDCSYCYYLDKAELYGRRQPKMNYELLEEFIRQYIEANDIPVVTFGWHGGEPLLAGLDYYRKAVEFQQKYKGDKKIDNNIQTNGTLLNREWCEFFRENNFLVGVSIDGPKDIHDAYRLDKGGKPTFDKIVENIEMMSLYGVEYNTLSTVNKKCEGRGAEVYRFMKSIGSHYMQFLPVVEHIVDVPGSNRPVIVPPGHPGSRLAEWSVSPEGFGRFMCDVFDEWVMSDVGQYYVQLFDVALAQWHGVPPSLCSFAETCGDALVVEHNGDVYSCDHYVYPEYKLGNIMQDDMLGMVRSKKQFKFGIDKRNSLPAECLKCKWYFACRGECPKHRFDIAANGEKNLNTLCRGYKLFFSHVDPYMKFMSDCLKRQQPPAMVMQWARQRMGFM